VYCLAVENTARAGSAEAARSTSGLMMVELPRISSHLVWLGTHAIDLGAMSVFLYCFREREEILRFSNCFAGQRMMTTTFESAGWHWIRRRACGRRSTAS